MLFTKRRKVIKERVKHDFKPPTNKYIVIPDRKIILVLFLGVLILGIWLFLNSSFFRIGNVLIDGISCAEKDSGFEQLCKTVNSYNGKNLVFMSEKEVVKKLESTYYLISNVKVSKRYPKDVIFSFNVRVPVAVISYSPNFSLVESSGSAVATESANVESTHQASYYADKDGIILGEVKDYSAKLPTLFSSKTGNLKEGEKFGGNKEVRALTLISKLTESGFLVVNMRILGDGILAKMDKGEVLFSDNKDTDLQVASLQLIVHTLTIDGRKYKRIDLRFEKPIVQ